MSTGSVTLGYNVDALAACSSGRLVAGCSNFIGPRWTGAVAVISVPADGGAPPAVEVLLELRAGVVAVAVLSMADEFTGRKVVATGSDDGSVDLWYLGSTTSTTASSAAAPAPAPGAAGQVGPLQHAQAKALHDHCVTSLAAAPGSSLLASGSADGTLRLWDCAQLLTCTGQLGSGGAGSAGLHAVAWAGDALLASAAADGRLCLWDTRQLGGAPAAGAAVGAPALSLAAVAAGGQQPLLVVGDQLGRVSVFDTRSCGQPLQQRQLHGDAVWALAAARGSGSGGSAMVATGSDDGSVMLLDCASLEASRQLAPAWQDGQVPCYVRALAWAGSDGQGAAGQQQRRRRLFRGGWDRAVAEVAVQ